MNSNGMHVEITYSQTINFLKSLKDSVLSDHYNYKESITCNLKNATNVRDFIAKNRPITMEIENSLIYYRLI